MSIEFDQIQMEPAYRKVAAAIGGRILNRSLREGDRLPPETELARQFGVNRSTVREALRELESNGLVTRRPGSKLMSVSRPQHLAIAGAVTRGLVLHDVTFMEVWEALTLLEPPIAEVAAGNDTSVRGFTGLRPTRAYASALRETGPIGRLKLRVLPKK